MPKCQLLFQKLTIKLYSVCVISKLLHIDKIHKNEFHLYNTASMTELTVLILIFGISSIGVRLAVALSK